MQALDNHTNHTNQSIPSMLGESFNPFGIMPVTQNSFSTIPQQTSGLSTIPQQTSTFQQTSGFSAIPQQSSTFQQTSAFQAIPQQSSAFQAFQQSGAQQNSYSHTVSLPTNGLPKDLRYANIDGVSEQLILLEVTQYNLAVVAPDNVILFNGAAKLDYVTLPNTNNKRKAFIIQKNNPVLIREVCRLFNDTTWKSECLFTPEEKDDSLPAILMSFTNMGMVGPYEVDVVEYSAKAIVLFSTNPDELKSKLPDDFKANNFTYIDGSKRRGFMLAKSSKIMSDLKKFVGKDFEPDYKVPVNGAKSSPAMTGYGKSTGNTYNQSSLGPGQSVAAPSFTPLATVSQVVKTTIKDDVISLLGKLKEVTGVDIKEVLSNTSIVYGEVEKVNDLLATYEKYETLLKVEVGNKQLHYIKIEMESI